MAEPVTPQDLQDITDALNDKLPSPNSVELDRLKADLAAATPGTVTYDNIVKKIEALGGKVPGKKTVTPKLAAKISFDYETMVKKPEFHVGPAKTTPFKNHPGTKVPEFISGGTKAQKAALARLIANTTITDNMASSDVAKIKQARQWYTGQTKGSSKGKAAVYDPGSVKDKILKAGGATDPTLPPQDAVKGKLVKDEMGNIIQWGDRKATAGYKWEKDTMGVGYILVPIPEEDKPPASPAPSPSPSATFSPDGEAVAAAAGDWLARPKPKGRTGQKTKSGQNKFRPGR